MMRMGADPDIVLDFLKRNFTLISLAMGESGALTDPKPASDAVRELREFFAAKSRDAWSYLDIVATKDDSVNRAIRQPGHLVSAF